VAFAIFLAHFEQGRYTAFAAFSAIEAGIGVIVFVLHGFHIALIVWVDQRWSAKITRPDPFRFYTIPVRYQLARASVTPTGYFYRSPDRFSHLCTLAYLLATTRATADFNIIKNSNSYSYDK
jgi:hypothetical protein